MLKNLIIRNYALIKALEINPTKGLNIVTGETGAGKSIMLGALGLLMGNRADTKSLLDENEKCIVEAGFDISGYDLQEIFEEEGLDYEKECIIRREISPSNKSRAFINDTPVTLDILKQIGQKLLDIHSQHDTLLLGGREYQLYLIDSIAGSKPILASYKEVFKKYNQASSKLDTLIREISENTKQTEFNTFLLKELTEAGLQADEQRQLEEEQKELENAEDIKLRLNQIIHLFNQGESNVISSIYHSIKNLDQLSSYSESYEPIRKRLETCYYEIKDINDEIEKKEMTVETGQERLEFINERLNKIYTLQKKHGVATIGDLLQIKEKLENTIHSTVDIEEEIEQLKKLKEELRGKLHAQATLLTKKRLSVTKEFSQQIMAILKEVGIANAEINIEHTPKEAGADGADNLKILFSANKGIAAQELKNAASGGEFSRLMLAIKYLLAEKISMPTIIFDEIDTGISGEVAIKVGKIMKKMAGKHQIIAISHLPQMAAMGEEHYFVYKDNSFTKTVSCIKKLSQDERIEEIAKMIGGLNPSETARKNALELLSM